MNRGSTEVVFVDGVRTPFGRAGAKGVFWRTRADDMGVKVVRELLRRNPALDPSAIGDVVFAATAQVGDQGLTLGRDVALLAGHPAHRARLRGRPHVRRRADRGDRRRGRDRDGRRATSSSRAASSTWATTRWAPTSTSTRASSRSG